MPQQMLTLLRDLAENNRRDWFLRHKHDYLDLQDAFKTACVGLRAQIEAFDRISSVKFYRIYKDARYSRSKEPYRTHRDVSFFRQKGGEYFLRVKPGGSYIIAGYWDISPDDLSKLHSAINTDAAPLASALSDPGLKQQFGELEPIQVKTAPRGFSKNHPAIDLIRKKAFLLKAPLSDATLLGPDFPDSFLRTYRAAAPLLACLDTYIGKEPPDIFDFF